MSANRKCPQKGSAQSNFGEQLLIDLDIIYQDDFLLVINKPPEIHSANIPGSTGLSIATLLAKAYPECLKASKKEDDAGLVNRLDFETSGLLIAGRTPEAWESLRLSLLAENMQKNYLAVVDGRAADHVFEKVYIGSPYRRSQKVKVYKDPPAKKCRALPTTSEFKLLEYNQDKKISLVSVALGSGKRHQIRAHARHLGHPLTGDKLYGSNFSFRDFFPDSTGIPLFFLHAAEVVLEHPKTKESLSLKANIPRYVAELFPAIMDPQKD